MGSMAAIRFHRNYKLISSFRKTMSWRTWTQCKKGHKTEIWYVEDVIYSPKQYRLLYNKEV